MKLSHSILIALTFVIQDASIDDRMLRADDAANVYEQRIKPLLKARCYACHGALKQEAGMRVDAVSLMMRGGDSGPLVVAGDPQSSLIVERISETDESLRMPPEGKPLTAEEIELIKS